MAAGEKKKSGKVQDVTRRDMEEAPGTLCESTSPVLYAVTFSASYEGQSFELDRYKAAILYKVSLN